MNAIEMIAACMRFQNPNIQPPYEHMTVRAEPVPMTTDPVPLPSDAGIEGHQRLRRGDDGHDRGGGRAVKARVHELVMVAGRVEASNGCPNHLTIGATERCPKCRARLEGAMEWLNRLDVERGPRWAEREVYG